MQEIHKELDRKSRFVDLKLKFHPEKNQGPIVEAAVVVNETKLKIKVHTFVILGVVIDRKSGTVALQKNI